MNKLNNIIIYPLDPDVYYELYNINENEKKEIIKHLKISMINCLTYIHINLQDRLVSHYPKLPFEEVEKLHWSDCFIEEIDNGYRILG